VTYNAMAIGYEQTSFDIEGENKMSTTKNGSPSGKGGNIDTRRNPFLGNGKVAARPNLASVPGMGAVIDSVLLAGAAVMLGATRDGGAVIITIFDGENRHRTYCSNERELESAWASINAAYEVE